MSGFDEILGRKIEVRRRTFGNSLDKDISDGSLDHDLFPEFTKLLEDTVPGDDESEGCPLPGTPEDESLIDAKEVRMDRIGSGIIFDLSDVIFRLLIVTNFLSMCTLFYPNYILLVLNCLYMF